MQTSKRLKSAPTKHHAFAGRHLLATYSECEASVIKDADRCLAALRDAVDALGATILGENVHRFPNGAVTAVLLLAESHATLHTYPEYESCFIDLFTCGVGDIDKFQAVLHSRLSPGQSASQVIHRGEPA